MKAPFLYTKEMCDTFVGYSKARILIIKLYLVELNLVKCC